MNTQQTSLWWNNYWKEDMNYKWWPNETVDELLNRLNRELAYKVEKITELFKH